MATPKAVGDVFNLGGHEEVSMNDLARRVISLANSKSEIRHIPYEQAYGRAFDDLPRRVPDLNKIKSMIGFTPHYSLDQIIKSVLDEQLVIRQPQP